MIRVMAIVVADVASDARIRTTIVARSDEDNTILVHGRYIVGLARLHNAECCCINSSSTVVTAFGYGVFQFSLYDRNKALCITRRASGPFEPWLLLLVYRDKRKIQPKNG